MAGSIRPKNGGFELVVSIGTDPSTGRRRRVSRMFTGSRRDAEKALAKLVTEADAGKLQSEATVAQLIEAWLDLAGRNLSPTTLRRYRGIVNRHLLPALGPVKLRRLDPARLERLYAELEDGGLAPRTVRQVHAVIRRALRQGERWGWCDRNVARLATTPAVSRSEVTAPPAELVARLIEAAATETLRGRAGPDVDLADFVYLAAVLGARRGELCGLQWADVDLDGGELTIRRAVIEVDGVVTVKATKTHAVRPVALDPTTVAVLREREHRCKLLALAVGTRLGPWVFGADVTHAAPWPPQTVSQRFRGLACRHAPGVRLHDLRHFAATLLLDAGIAVPTVSRRLGHRDAATTLSIYAHAVSESDRRAAEILGGAVSRG